MNSHKKKFQKPNILRRKPILNKSSFVQKNKSENYEYQDMKTLLASSFVLEPNTKESRELKDVKSVKLFDSNKQSVHKVDNDLPHVLCNIQLEENDIAKNIVMCVDSPIAKTNNELNQNQTINVEPFLSEPLNQNIPVFECFTSQNKLENELKQKWCLELSQDSPKIIIEQGCSTELETLCTEQKTDNFVTISHTEESIQNQQSNVLENAIFTPVTNVRIQSIGQLITISPTFKCDVPDCNKEFISKQKLNKHISIHNKNNNTKPQRPITVECPAKKVHENGVEEPCGRIFHVREDVMKHLNEDHTIDDAIYNCTECERRFFWVSGLRAHARSHALRVQIPCPWPGCARVFRQPCRLREHSRAHTGDRPYPCLYPNCGWSFRTASKLMRHARRHTGDRRHACAACGRAFLRREHLRDHATRHTEPGHRATHVCPHADCQQSFSNMSSLYMHMKKVHKNKVIQQPAVEHTDKKQEQPVSKKVQNMFVVNLLEPTQSTEIESTEVESTDLESNEVEHIAVEVETNEVFQDDIEEGHSARTHCTWPLTSRTLQYQHNAYVLGDDVQVEQSEGSESNIRSDLFLHGNVLHNEDSEQMGRCGRGSEGEGEGDGDGAARGGALSLDADLLLDAPSVHLDQEELYTDAVESSFRVFLLSGEELT